ncbi:MAG TPA: phosphotransferase [Dermatophilaceae bacterium]|nr:phosphotransferase [Dermatophilaceae bacterium]
MTRSAYFLAALASAALPGLDPVSVQRVRPQPADSCDIAFVKDAEGRTWVIQAPRTPVAGAMLEDIAELSALLAHRLDIAVPAVQGQVVVPEGRALVFPRLPGRPLDLRLLPEGLGLAADIGRALAHVHNLEVALFEEAGRPAYDADTTRARHLSDLDRAAATGHVPTALLSRWERELEDVSLWRFLPTPVHGSFTGSNILASFDDDDDAGAGRVSALLGWEDAHVGDPAEDFAELTALAPPAALQAVVDAYGPSRIDRPDSHLLARARLSSEMRLIRRLLRAVAAEERALVDQAAQDLRDLDERVFAEAQRKASAAEARPPVRRLLSEDVPATPPDEPSQQPPQRAAASDIETVAVPLSPADPPPTRWDVVTQAVPYGAVEESSTPSGAGDLPTRGEGQDAEAESSADPAPGRSEGALESANEPAPEQPSEPDSSPPGGPESVPQAGDADPRGASSQAVAPPQPAPDRAGLPADELAEPDADAERRAGSDAAHQSALLFEIEDAEPLDDGGVLDLHEGASEFVPVERRPPPSSSPESD